MANSRTHMRKAFSSVVAAGSNSQANAVAIPRLPIVFIATVSSTTRGARLPSIIYNDATGTSDTEQLTVVNLSTTAVKVYPATSQNIGTASNNAATTVAGGATSIFTASSATNWRVK